jgi:very-short-patch-repair endonuclease
MQICGKACYECLLDYGNQPDHKDLDRYLIRDLLADLSRAVCRPAGGIGSRAERMAALRKRCDSQLEKRWLDLVDTLVLRPPSDAQYPIDTCSTRPDFYYRDQNAAIYIDGPPHDDPAKLREDESVTQQLLEMGYIVIRFHHKADWQEIFLRHPDIFGTASQTQPREEELAVVTLLFSKSDDKPFTEDDRKACRREGDAALKSLIAQVASATGTKLSISFVGEGLSSFWYEVAIMAAGAIAATPYCLHALGEALQAGGNLTSQLSISMGLTGLWLKSVAWRLTPKNPNDSDPRRPGCFGIKNQLDRRYKRCRDCSFLQDCMKAIKAVLGS